MALPTYDSSMTDNSVYVLDPQGQFVSPVNPAYCATLAGAEVLQTYLKTLGITVTITMDWPLSPGQPWGYFTQSKQVPYVDDGKGAHENAGGLIWNYKVLPSSLADFVAKQAFVLDDTTQGS